LFSVPFGVQALACFFNYTLKCELQTNVIPANAGIQNKKVKSQLIAILLIPGLMAIIMTVLNFAFRSKFYFNRFKQVLWLIPVIEFGLIILWALYNFIKINKLRKLRYVLFHGMILWGMPVGFSMFINNYCTDLNISFQQGLGSVIIYSVVGIFSGLYMYSNSIKNETTYDNINHKKSNN